MKNIHLPTILVTLGLVGLVAILSGQNMVGAPRVTVHNPLGVPGWVPSDVWMASALYDKATSTWITEDYTVPTGHFALVRTMTAEDPYRAFVEIDEGNGFEKLAAMGYAGGNLDPGIVVDEGTTIRANPNQTVHMTVHGYLIPK